MVAEPIPLSKPQPIAVEEYWTHDRTTRKGALS